MKVKKSEKAGLKLNIQNVKIRTSSPITSWQIDGETLETVTDFIFLGFRITADNDCSHEIKRCLLLGRKAMTNLDSILKNKRFNFADKGPQSQTYDFSSSDVWVWQPNHKERWASQNRCFWTVGLENSWESLGQQRYQTSQFSRESTLNIHWKDWCWSWSSNTLATWSEELTHWKRSWCWERLKAGGERDDRGWDGWMASPNQQTWVWANSRR